MLLLFAAAALTAYYLLRTEDTAPMPDNFTRDFHGRGLGVLVWKCNACALRFALFAHNSGDLVKRGGVACPDPECGSRNTEYYGAVIIDKVEVIEGGGHSAGAVGMGKG